MASRKFADEIDKNLKAAFNDAASEEVPDHFIELLARLQEAEEKSKKQKRGNGSSENG